MVSMRDGLQTATHPVLGPHVGSYTPADVTNVPTLTGRRTTLRPVDESDYDFLYALGCDEELGFRWRHRGETPSPDAFHQGLWTGILAQFVICANADSQRVGHVFVYNANFRFQTAFIAMAVKPSLVRRGWTLEAGKMFINYTFSMWPLRKLYAEVPEFNFAQFSSGTGKAFQIEGCMRDHEFYAGRYWDLLILALYREAYMKTTPLDS